MTVFVVKSKLEPKNVVLFAACHIFVCVVFRSSDDPHIGPRFRQFPHITKKQVFDSEFLAGAMWFWILWHFWHDFDAVMVSHTFKYYTTEARRMYEVKWGQKLDRAICQSWGEKCVYIMVYSQDDAHRDVRFRRQMCWANCWNLRTVGVTVNAPSLSQVCQV